MLRGGAAFTVFLAHTTMYFGYLAPKCIVSTYTGAFGVNVFYADSLSILGGNCFREN